jgi:DNA-binding CsgD family transcriptional regulator
MDVPQLENLPEDGKKGENHFSIFVYPFEHGLDFKGRDDFLNNVRDAGWRPWVWRLRDGIELFELPISLKTWFHPPTLEALYPDVHRILDCRNYYQDFCPHCGKDPTSAEMEVASLLTEGKTREEILASLHISPDALSPMEFEVAALAGERRSPDQIAEQLNESRRSVDYYRRIFRHKVGECTRDIRQTLSSILFRRATSQTDKTGDLAPFWFEYSPENTLKLTFELKSRTQKEWVFSSSGNSNQGIRFCIDWIDAYLFPFGVGFLCMKVHLKGEDARIDRLMDFNQGFRDIDARGKIYRYGLRVDNGGLNKIEFLGQWLAGLSRDASGNTREPMQFRLKDYNSRYKIFSFASLKKYDSYWSEDLGRKTAYTAYYKGIDWLDALLYEVATTSSISTLERNDISGWR